MQPAQAIPWRTDGLGRKPTPCVHQLNGHYGHIKRGLFEPKHMARLAHAELRVFVGLIAFACNNPDCPNADKLVTKSQTALAERLGVTRATYYKAVERLGLLGYIRLLRFDGVTLIEVYGNSTARRSRR